MIDAELLRLRVLLYFYKAEENGPTVTECAKSFQTEKYTISRIVKSLAGAGYMDNSNPRRLRLTQSGSLLAKQLNAQVETNIARLLLDGADPDAALHDAYVMALYFSPETLAAIRKNQQLTLLKYGLKDRKGIGGENLFRRMEDGSYQFPFFISKKNAETGGTLSMADRGFEHPCTVKVVGGAATIYLKAKVMTEISAFSGSAVTGTVSRIRYFCDGAYAMCEQTADIFSFPAHCLTFENAGGASGPLLHGSVMMKFRCSAGSVHMPESAAVFTLLI